MKEERKSQGVYGKSIHCTDAMHYNAGIFAQSINTRNIKSSHAMWFLAYIHSLGDDRINSDLCTNNTNSGGKYV